MHYAIAVILAVSWITGLVTSYTMGGFVHILLLTAVVGVLVRAVRGIFEIIAAVQLRKGISNVWAPIIGGIISIIFSVVLFANPTTGVLGMVWLIGSFALVFGVMKPKENSAAYGGLVREAF